MPDVANNEVTKIYENTQFTVKARIENKDAKSIQEVTFKFLKDGEQFEEKTIPMSQANSSGDHMIVSHAVQVPAVPEDKDRYFLDYHYFYKVKSAGSTESLQNFPSARIQVFPRFAQLKVTDKDGKAFPNFEFKVEQDGQCGPVRKTVASDTPNAKGESIPAGSCEFNLELFPNFRLVPSPPYQIAEEVVGTGRKREIKGAIGFRAVFTKPAAGTIKQYVNFEVENLGQGGIGHAVTVEVGVHPEDLPFLNAGDTSEIHFRVTYGPAADEPVAKSARNDTKYPTKALKVSDADTSATVEEKEANKKYSGKVTLADGAGKFVVALGKAGGDTCLVEIAGSDKFLNNESMSPDATLTFENWRRVYYEVMVPDIMLNRALELMGEDRDRDWNFQSAVLQKLEGLGRQLFIEFKCAKIHRFNAQKYSDHGSLVPGSFLGLQGLANEPVYVLTGRNWRKLPTGKSWLVEQPGKSLYIHVCDALLKWRKDTEDEQAGATDFSGTITEAIGFINMQDKFQGLFMPFSGFDAGDGIASITWTADISKDDNAAKYTPKLEIVEESAANLPKPPIDLESNGQDANRKLTVSLGHESIVFTREAEQSFVAGLGESQVSQIQKFVDGCLADKARLAEANGEIKATIAGEGDSEHGAADCLKAVKDKLQELFDATKKDFAWHPGLDSHGEPRTGWVPLRDFTDVQKSTINEWHFRFPFAFIGKEKTRNACPVKVEFSVQPHQLSPGEADGKLIAWACDQATGAKELAVLVLKAFSGTTDEACVANPHNPGLPGDCLQLADALCADCITHGRSRDLTNIK